MCTKAMSNVAFGNYKIPKNIKHIPNFKKLWLQFCSLKYAEDFFKNKLLNELITECSISNTKFLMHSYGKKSLISMEFGTLQRHGVVLDRNSITESLLSYLEPFPFDNEKLEKIKLNKLFVGRIRNVIEKQYLIWKYQINDREVEELLYRFQFCLYPFRSIRNLRKNISILDSMSRTQSKNIAETIYLINQKPFSLTTVKNFEENVVGINWRMFPHHSFKIVRHSHHYILFIVSVLQQLEFTDTQIREGFPLLHFSFKLVIFRLNNLLGNPEVSKYRNEKYFLLLLYFNSQEISKLIVYTSFTELIEVVRISLKHRPVVLTENIVRHIVSQFYEIENRYYNIISRHSKYKQISEKQIYDTLFFLKENNFTSEEVAESITIIFYPRHLIAETLRKIKEEESVLKKFGFDDECVSEETNFFTAGTKGKRKVLQLCLYYIEKSSYISGNKMTEMEPDAT